MIVLYTNVFYF